MPIYQVMSFSDLVAQVVIETSRPDMTFIEAGGTGEIPRALQAATLKMHGLDFFSKDILSAQAIFNAAAYIQTLDTTTLARYRQIAYIRKWDPTLADSQLNPLLSTSSSANPSDALALLQIIDIDDIFDDYGSEKVNVCYQAGYTIWIKSSTSLAYAQMGWYAYPNVDISNSGANFTSWIANTYPYALIYDASSKIYSGTGQQDQSRKFDSPEGQGGLVQGEIMRILRDNIRLGGR